MSTRYLYEKSQWRYRTRKQALHTAGYQCVRCGRDWHKPVKLAHVHHVVPTEGRAWSGLRSV